MTPTIDEGLGATAALSFAFGFATGSAGGYCLGKNLPAKQDAEVVEVALSEGNQRLMTLAIDKCNSILESDHHSSCATGLARMIAYRILPDLKNSYSQVVRNNEVDLAEQRVGRSLDSLVMNTLRSINDALDRVEESSDYLPKKAPLSENVVNIIKIEEFFNRARF